MSGAIVIILIVGVFFLFFMPEAFFFILFMVIVGSAFVSCSDDVSMDSITSELEQVVVELEAAAEAKAAADPNAPPEEQLVRRMDILLEVTKMCDNHREIEFIHEGKLYNIGCGMPYIRDVE